jgi:hypothetical protein
MTESIVLRLQCAYQEGDALGVIVIVTWLSNSGQPAENHTKHMT